MAPVDPTNPRTIAIAFAVVVGVALLVGGATGTTAFGVHNPEWDGSAELRSVADETGTDVIIAEETARYDEVDPNGTVAVITRPGEYEGADLERLVRFVDRGGTLVLAAKDDAVANQLLEALGASARIDGAPLRDDREHADSPAFPVVTNRSDHPYVEHAEGLTLNHGTAIDPGSATVLARSSEFSYLDRTGDGEPSEEEGLASYPVVTIETVGGAEGVDSDQQSGGDLVLVSDPSVFINAMLERDGNRGFAVALLDAHDRVLLDQTNTGIPPLVAIVLAIQRSALLAVLLGLVLLGGILAFERNLLGRLWPGESETTGTVTDHPIDPGRIESEDDDSASVAVDRVAQGVINARQQRDTDDRRG